MNKETIKIAINNQDQQSVIEFLEDKTVPIEDVKTIYYGFKGVKDVVGQVAMNLSLRTSVYDRDLEYSQTIIELLKEIATEDDMGSRWAVAKNPHTPVEILELLAKDKINLVRALVATNPNTPSQILEDFFTDEKIVRDGLSGNPNTPKKILKILVSDNDKMVRLRLAENENISEDILDKLCDDLDPDVAKAAKIHKDRKES